jgi:hypothetical protein
MVTLGGSGLESGRSGFEVWLCEGVSAILARCGGQRRLWRVEQATKP